MKPILLRALASLSLALAAPLVHAADAGAAAPACRYVAVAKLPLHYTGPMLQITTDGVINGTAARMLVDTGAYESFLTRTGTERRGMTLRNTGSVAQGVGGFSSIYQTRISEFSAGPARSEPGTMRVLSDFAFTPSFDAILGAPFLLQADLEISLATKELKFFRPNGCADAFLGYWDPDAQVVPFESSFEGSPNPHITVLVNGQKMIAMIDTGAQASSISLAAAQRAGVRPDTPGVTRATDVVGVGERKAARWQTVFNTFQIGEQTIRNADIGIIERQGKFDVILGADFLRAHRVLFAMSQRKLYFSYVGGQPFGADRKLAPWIQAEAEAGNADAQMALAAIYGRGKQVPRDAAASGAWLEKAAANGNPYANLQTGRALVKAGRAAEAAARLRSALDQLPASRDAALWLYLARLRNGQAELGRAELTAAFARSEGGEWPAPVAAFYLGKLGAAQLLEAAAAGADGAEGKRRTCMSIASMVDLYGAQGDTAQAAQATALGRQQCGSAGQAGGQGNGAAAGKPVAQLHETAGESQPVLAPDK